jgi:pyruvate ferredoxin oxidoreductase alpha subunit
MGKQAVSNQKVIEASMAVAIAVKLCEPQVVPMYPITPQTHIVERIADFIADGDMNAEMIHAESEHAALSAALGSVATGVRTFTATASQGLMLMYEVLPIMSGMRLPMVMAVANRAISAPINIWNDHSDSVAARDMGWIQLYVESAQEALDTTIMAFKISEDHRVLLPVMVCLDGFTLSHVYENVDIPIQAQVRRYLPRFKPLFTLDPKHPVTMGPVGFPDSYMEFRKQLDDAILGSAKVISDANSQYQRVFKRSYGDGLIETYQMQGAKTALIGMGTLCGTARVVVDELRKKGQKVGLIKLKCYRPFPTKQLREVTKNLTTLAVVDRASSYGYEGALAIDVKAALRTTKLNINTFIAGLGGRDITLQDIHYMLTAKNKENHWINVQ